MFSSWMVGFASRPDVGLPEGAKRTRAQAIADMGPGFIAFFVINAGFLIASMMLLRASVGLTQRATLVATLAGSGLLFNDITKAYLLSPHSQLMNIVLPMVMVALLYRWFRGEDFSARLWWVLGVLCGYGLLAYATWALVPVVLAVAVAGSWMRGGAERARARRAAPYLAGIALLLALPYAAWYFYVVRTAGYFYVHETSYDGGLVWLWRNDVASVLVQLAGNLTYLLRAAVEQCVPYAVFLLPAVVALTVARKKLDVEERRSLGLSAAAAALITLLFLVFFALLGFRIWRYAVPLLPAWTLPIALLNEFARARLTSPAGRRLHAAALAFLAVLVGLYEVAKDGPWG
jgi:hypothetical protein